MLKKYFYLATFLATQLLTRPCLAFGGLPLSIGGWPTEVLTSVKPGPALAYDPIWGRLLCPPALRLIPKTGEFDGLLIDLPKASSPKPGAIIWEYNVKSGLYWWDGRAFTAQDLAFFLEEQLAKIILEKTELSVPPNSYSIQKINERKLQVSWTKDPGVGPFIISGHPISKKSTKKYYTEFACVGTYFPDFSSGKTLVLKPITAYGYSTPPLKIDPKSNSSDIQIFFAENEAKDIPPNCPNISLPYLTMLIPLRTEKMGHYEIRKFVKNTLPGRHQLQTITQGFFDLLDTPIINLNKNSADEKRNDSHTGINKDALWEYAHKHGLMGSKDKFLEISLSSLGSPIPPALMKILSDNMASQGFLLKILDEKQEKNADLILYTYRADSPEMNLLAFLSSLNSFPLVLDEKGTHLVRSMSLKYLQQLSLAKWRRDILEDINKIFLDQLVFLPILQYKACIFSRRDKQLNNLNFDDESDWIKRFLKGKI